METRIQSIAHLVVALYAVFLFFEGIRRRREIERFSYISIVNAGIGAWNFFLFLYYRLESPDAVYFVSQLGFVSVTVTLFGLFFFSWRYSFGMKHDHLLLLFAVVPVITSLLSLTAHFQPFFLMGHEGFKYLPLRELTMLYGPWFIVHSVFSYLLISVSLVLLVMQYFKRKKKNRIAKLLFVLSLLIFSIFLYFSNFTSLKGHIQQYSFLGHLVCISILYWATFMDEDDSVIYYGKNRFYDNVGMPVMMFNTLGELIHLNTEAACYFSSSGVPVERYYSYTRIFEGAPFSRISLSSGSDGDKSFFVQNMHDSQTIFIKHQDILNRRNVPIGFSLTLYDLSTMNSFVKDLERRAYTDELCQCQNRTCFEERRRSILDTAPRPLGLFVVDIDNLKVVNDTFGHVEGDSYIRVCVDALKKVIRSTDFFFRLGGDEFIFFLSGLDDVGLLRVQKALAQELAGVGKKYPCSLSIGYSILGEGDMDFDRHFAIADSAMYQQKRNKKTGQDGRSVNITLDNTF